VFKSYICGTWGSPLRGICMAWLEGLGECVCLDMVVAAVGDEGGWGGYGGKWYWDHWWNRGYPDVTGSV
jgi:hypothetical protein